MNVAYPFLLTLVACVHSDPLAFDDQEIPGPFSGSPPVRLTYSAFNDGEPGFSADGAWITYQYERGTPDRDRCIGVMPATGGQRHWEFCPWEVGQATSADGLANAALRDDGTVVFTMHSGLIGNLTSTSAGLYVAPVDSIAGAIKVLPLLARPPGGSSPWHDLIDPIWLRNDELLVLAAQRLLVNMTCTTIESCPYDMDRNPNRDTVQLGVEIARMRVSTAGVAMLQLIPAAEAIAWSADTSTDLLHLVVQRADPEDVEFFHESIADTLFRMSIAGGAIVALYGVPQAGSERVAERLHGVASAGGRVFISRSWRRPQDVENFVIIPVGTPLQSDISEVMPDGSLRTVAAQLSWHWGRLRLSADGRSLLAEAVERNSTDLYLIDVGP